MILSEEKREENKKSVDNNIKSIENKTKRNPVKYDSIEKYIINEDDFYSLIGYKKGLLASGRLDRKKLKEYKELIDEKLHYLWCYTPLNLIFE